MSMPIIKPIILPNGPALETKEVPVTTNDHHPIAVPIDKAKAPKTDMLFKFDLFSMAENNYIAKII